MSPLVTAGRLVLGAWLLADGIAYFSGLLPPPAGHTPLAIQLMTAAVHSGLLDVVMAMQAVTGALILAALFVPAALAVVMPIATCAAYWAIVLDRQPLGIMASLAFLALVGLLMLAHFEQYRGVLRRWALATGEDRQRGMNYESLFVEAGGRTSRSDFAGALALLALVAALYLYLVAPSVSYWVALVLLVPSFVLHARRLHDMGRSGWLLLLPGLLLFAALWLHAGAAGGAARTVVAWGAALVCGGFALWGLLGSSDGRANRFGAPAT